MDTAIKHAPALNSISSRQAAISIAAQSCVSVMKMNNGADQNTLAIALKEFIAQQIGIASEICKSESKLDVNSLCIAGDLLRSQSKSSDKLTTSMVLEATDKILLEMADAGSGTISALLSDSNKSLQSELLRCSARLFSLFVHAPMSNDPVTATSFMVSAIITMANQVTSPAERDYEAVVTTMIGPLTDLVADVWVEVCCVAINPAAETLLARDVESILSGDFLHTLSLYPLGHDGNEQHVVRLMAGYVHELASTLTNDVVNALGDAAYQPIRASFVRLYLSPLVGIAWKRQVDGIVSTIKDLDENDISNYLVENHTEPLDLAIVFAELRTLALSRETPLQTVKLDLHEVEATCIERFTTLWGVVRAVESMLPKGDSR